MRERCGREPLMRLAAVLPAVVIAGSCAGAQPTAAPPAQRLPHPMAAPSFTATQRDSVRTHTTLLNNFGLYQIGRDRDGTYMHDGLDFMAPNGTKVYAIAPGRVERASGPQYGGVVVVRDAADPTRAWSYAHVDSFQVRVGDVVRTGDYLAQVHFLPGSDHLHLDRHVTVGPDSVMHENPIAYFDLPDPEPPIIEAPFRWYRDGTDSLIASPGSAAVLSGAVDIVAGIRDPAPFASSGDDAFTGDRLAPLRIAYEIRSAADGALVDSIASFDFGRMLLTPAARQTQAAPPIALTVLRYFPDVRDDLPWASARFSYYIVTNAPPPGSTGLSHAYADGAWQTDARDDDGRRRFPDGEYIVTVRAWDAAGNASHRSERVHVRN